MCTHVLCCTHMDIYTHQSYVKMHSSLVCRATTIHAFHVALATSVTLLHVLYRYYPWEVSKYLVCGYNIIFCWIKLAKTSMCISLELEISLVHIHNHTECTVLLYTTHHNDFTATLKLYEECWCYMYEINAVVNKSLNSKNPAGVPYGFST